MTYDDGTFGILWLEIVKQLAMENEKHLEIAHVTRSSSHSFLAEFLLFVV